MRHVHITVLRRPAPRLVLSTWTHETNSLSAVCQTHSFADWPDLLRRWPAILDAADAVRVTGQRPGPHAPPEA